MSNGRLRSGAGPLFTTADSLLGWRLEPGQRARHRTAELDTEIRLDDVGDRAAPPGLVSTGPLAVFVGDSLAFGFGVDAERAFLFVVSKDLALGTANLGVPGFGPDQEYLRLLRPGLPRRPQLVVLAPRGSDLVDVASALGNGDGVTTFRDGHWNERGHRLVACGLERALLTVPVAARLNR